MRRAALLGVLALGLVSVACRRLADEVPVVTVHRGRFEKVLPVTGTLAAQQTLNLPAPTQGKLSFIVPEGAVVKVGDVVFSLETKEMQERLDAANIDLTVAESGQGKAQEEIRSERVKNDLSLRETTAQLQSAEMELTRAEDDLAKKRRQVENSILPAAEIPAAELQVEQARLSLENARIALERLQEEMKSRKETLQLDLQAAQARVEKSRTQVEEAEEFLAKATVTAPRDGVVVHARSWRGQEWKAGDEVWQRQPVVELPDLSVMEVQLEIHEADISEVAVGVPARVRLEAWPDLQLDGSIAEISGVAKELRDRDGKGTGVRAFDAKIALAAQDARLRPGMTARVEIVLDVRQDALVIPVVALHREGGRARVVMQSGEEREIEVAATSADLAVVTSGLSEGDAVRVVARRARGAERAGKPAESSGPDAGSRPPLPAAAPQAAGPRGPAG